MSTKPATIADPSVCGRCEDGDELPGGGVALCLVCALEEQVAGSPIDEHERAA